MGTDSSLHSGGESAGIRAREALPPPEHPLVTLSPWAGLRFGVPNLSQGVCAGLIMALGCLPTLAFLE